MNFKKEFFENLIYLIDFKDKYTRLHSENVSKYAVLLGKNLNLDNDSLEILKIGGLLHDIGKIGIPDYILKKDSLLTEEEYRVVKKHPLIGEAIFSYYDYLEISQIIRNHHEKMDGSGYPDGLIGKNIPYFCRIISIADAFDAMTTKRSYNEVKTLEEAIDELKECSLIKFDVNGKMNQHFDNELVNSFIASICRDEKILEHFYEKDKKIIRERAQYIKNKKTD